MRNRPARGKYRRVSMAAGNPLAGPAAGGNGGYCAVFSPPQRERAYSAHRRPIRPASPPAPRKASRSAATAPARPGHTVKDTTPARPTRTCPADVTARARGIVRGGLGGCQRPQRDPHPVGAAAQPPRPCPLGRDVFGDHRVGGPHDAKAAVAGLHGEQRHPSGHGAVAGGRWWPAPSPRSAGAGAAGGRAVLSGFGRARQRSGRAPHGVTACRGAVVGAGSSSPVAARTP
jgi:hypothetical protein